MAEVYRQRHPERSVFYRVLFHYFESFLLEYGSRFEREYMYFRPIIQEVVDRYLDCGNPLCGFARIRCPECGEEQLLCFSCKTRSFCPSCHAKRREEWSEWMDYPEFIARVTSHIPDKGQVMVRFYGLYSNAHRGKMRKREVAPSCPLITEDEQYVPSRGWAEMIRKVYEIDPLLCPQCGIQMKIIPGGKKTSTGD